MLSNLGFDWFRVRAKLDGHGYVDIYRWFGLWDSDASLNHCFYSFYQVFVGYKLFSLKRKC